VEEPTVDLDQVDFAFPSGKAPILVTGVPGAASPPGAILRAMNLDQVDDPVDTVILDDGSFTFELWGEWQDEVRFQIIADKTRSKPLDFILTDHPTPSVRALGDCLILTPALELVTSTSNTIQVRNDCAQPVELAAPSMRRPVSAVAPDTSGTWPTSLATGQSLTVVFTVFSPDPFEDVAFITATAPAYDRRPITLRQ